MSSLDPISDSPQRNPYHSYSSDSEIDSISGDDEPTLQIEKQEEEPQKQPSAPPEPKPLRLPSGNTAMITPVTTDQTKSNESVTAAETPATKPARTTSLLSPTLFMMIALPFVIGTATALAITGAIALPPVLAIAVIFVAVADFKIRIATKEQAEKYMEGYANDIKDHTVSYEDFIKNNGILSKPKHLEIKDDNAIKMNTFRKDAFAHKKNAQAYTQLQELKDEYKTFQNGLPPADPEIRKAKESEYDQKFERLFTLLKTTNKSAIAKELNLNRDLQLSDLKKDTLTSNILTNLKQREEKAAGAATANAKQAFEDLRESVKDKEPHEIRDMVFETHGLQGQEEAE